MTAIFVEFGRTGDDGWTISHSEGIGGMTAMGWQ